MYRSILLAIAATTLSTVADAQFVQRIGMQQGMAVSHLRFNYDPDPTVGVDDATSNLYGYSARIHADLLEGRYFHLAPGIGFLQRGGTSVDRFLPPGGSIGWIATASTLNYVTFDVSAKAGIAFGKCTPYAFAGPRYDVLLNASTTFQLFDELRALERTRTGLRYGAGVDVDLGSLSVFAEWCGLWSVNDVTTDITLPVIDINDGQQQVVDLHIEDRTYAVSVGVALRLCQAAAPATSSLL